jgi:predicted lipoprotein with Yx(FWY)xxD motif
MNMDRILSRAARVRARMMVVGVLGVGVLVALAGTAIAFTVTSLTTARRTVSGRSMTIVVDNRGVTVYELGGESLAHLECITRTCFSVWPPLTVSSSSARVTKSAGVPGTLSIMHRVKGGFYQVMLDRHPLYHYSGDRGTSGPTMGNGITSFGGRWQVIQGG